MERRRADEAEVELARLRALLEESGRSYPERTRVLAAVVERGGRVLLARRPAGKRHAGLWELPGGKFLPGESPLEAARRELAEELGVEVATAGALLWEAPDPGSPFVVEFYAVEIRGEPAALEHDALAWVLPEELPLYPLAPSDRAFAEGLRDGRVKKGDGGGREGG
ncbi:MAG TPA: NUDIX domain-containing protein [Thermoanaerobaculia bacterium]|nr:NUDIX domain-containing protein [Thermoanaerobaculia bacterium]